MAASIVRTAAIMTIRATTARRGAAEEALADAVRRVTVLLRSGPDPDAPAVGVWTLAEVAMHLSQAWVVVPALARGDPSRIHEVLPDLAGDAESSVIADLWDLGAVTKHGVTSDPERDLKVLADRIEERAGEFFAESVGRSAREPRPWLVEGTVVPRSVLTCHLLSETLMHGYDIASAARVRWPIERSHAAMVLAGFIVEIVRALDPRALVDQDRARGRRIAYDVRLRSEARFTFVFDDGRMVVEEPGSQPVDCHISADPTALLLVAWGRRSQWKAIARGQIAAWGRKPWLGPQLRGLVRNP